MRLRLRAWHCVADFRRRAFLNRWHIAAIGSEIDLRNCHSLKLPPLFVGGSFFYARDVMQQVRDTIHGCFSLHGDGITYPSQTAMEILIAVHVVVGAVAGDAWS